MTFWFKIYQANVVLVNGIWICSQVELKILDRKKVQFLYAHNTGFGGFSGILVTGCALKKVYHTP